MVNRRGNVGLPNFDTQKSTCFDKFEWNISFLRMDRATFIYHSKERVTLATQYIHLTVVSVVPQQITQNMNGAAAGEAVLLLLANALECAM